MKRLVVVLAAAPVAIAAGLAGLTALLARGAQRACPPVGRTLGAGRASLQVLDEGHGPPVVLIHGLAGNLRNWRFGVVGHLTGAHRVIAFDRPGCGYSKRRRGARAGLRAEAATAAALIGRLGLGRPLVVGHSLGGAIALALAAEYPDRVGGLALVSPLVLPGAVPSPPFRLLLLRSPALRLLFAWTIALPIAMRRRAQTASALFGPERPPPDFAIAGGGMLGLRPSSFIAASADLEALRVDDGTVTKRLGTIGAPVAVLAGRDDRILPAGRQAEKLPELLPGATVELVEGAGHMLPVTRPALVADFIRRAGSALGERRP